MPAPTLATLEAALRQYCAQHRKSMALWLKEESDAPAADLRRINRVHGFLLALDRQRRSLEALGLWREDE